MKRRFPCFTYEFPRVLLIIEGFIKDTSLEWKASLIDEQRIESIGWGINSVECSMNVPPKRMGNAIHQRDGGHLTRIA
jgi:hypothetical protein